MFDIAPTELLVVALVALVAIGPKDLPKAMRFVGHWVGKARGMARHFRAGLDTMMREAELEDLEREWRAQNERIMRDFPRIDAPASTPTSAPLPPTPPATPAPVPAPTPPADVTASDPAAAPREAP